ncbi:MAG TPA: PAS domain S-box protein [Candidatus Acidoferrales bacterium]|nr:PAS domain S-box protein [Candidatus Acidoferrales bacterium]
MAGLLLFLAAVIEYSAGRVWRVAQMGPLAALCLLITVYAERSGAARYGTIGWQTSILGSAIQIFAGWILWRDARTRRGLGARLLAGAFWVSGLHAIDGPHWPEHPLFLLRVAFDHLMGVVIGMAMAVMVLEAARTRTEDLNEKLRRLTLITTASAQTLRVNDVLEPVLAHLVQSLNASHGLIRLTEGAGESAALVLRASVGFSDSFKKKFGTVSVQENWVRRVLSQGCSFHTLEAEQDPKVRQKMAQDGIAAMVLTPLPGKEGPLGALGIGLSKRTHFEQDEVNFIMNVGNLLGLTIQNVTLFERAATVQKQWAYTFDSIQDPILVHDVAGNILRVNQRLARSLDREVRSLVGRPVADILDRKGLSWRTCPYCEGIAGQGDDPDPWLKGFFLASNSDFSDPSGHRLGTVHALKDMTDRKRAEEKYRKLVENLQEGVFVSTPNGRLLDFNDAFVKMFGYESREELLSVDIPTAFYVNPSDRERMQRLIQEHGALEDFEVQLRRKDGEILTVLESSIATRDISGAVTAYQGFLLDITERKRAEQEVRRRNRELMVLNSIGQTLSQPLELPDLLSRSLRQITELFGLDVASIYLLNEKTCVIRRAAAFGHRSEYMRHFPQTEIHRDLINHVRAVHASVLPFLSLPLPQVFRDVHEKEGLQVAYVVVLWSKDRILGCLAVGSRTRREFTPADLNLLGSTGTQFAAAIEKSLLYEEARQAYDNLRRAQEQLVQSEKMAAVGQLISGVAHELNNPLTAILGYSQLLASSDGMSQTGVEYVEKLHKQAQRTHRIVQNLLSFSRQQKPERLTIDLNRVLEDTLGLRDYDLRVNNIQVHRDLAPNLPPTAADPHQLQQVFLNILNNAVDAILDKDKRGDIWVRSSVEERQILVEFTDSGPGVQDPSRVFDPFYTTKPVGKGTGLGLSICYGIISEHGGSIRVQNSPPRGAAFSVTLPVQSATETAGPNPPELPQRAAAGRVLVVDDEEAVLELEREILESQGFSVRMARSGREAQQILSCEGVDLVVTDLKMPGEITGKELYDWISRQHPDLAGRVVFTMSDARSDEVKASLEGKGCQVIQKPFDLESFSRAIYRGLRRATAPALRR